MTHRNASKDTANDRIKEWSTDTKYLLLRDDFQLLRVRIGDIWRFVSSLLPDCIRMTLSGSHQQNSELFRKSVHAVEQSLKKWPG